MTVNKNTVPDTQLPHHLAYLKLVYTKNTSNRWLNRPPNNTIPMSTISTV